MALYPVLFGHVEIREPDERRPTDRPTDVRVVRRPKPFGPGGRR
ncbi:MAG TPA: hypothetical protein VH950_04230 [Gaiellaceae bacterium]|jgi:hypothetical protein